MKSKQESIDKLCIFQQHFRKIVVDAFQQNNCAVQHFGHLNCSPSSCMCHKVPVQTPWTKAQSVGFRLLHLYTLRLSGNDYIWQMLQLATLPSDRVISSEEVWNRGSACHFLWHRICMSKRTKKRIFATKKRSCDKSTHLFIRRNCAWSLPHLILQQNNAFNYYIPWEGRFKGCFDCWSPFWPFLHVYWKTRISGPTQINWVWWSGASGVELVA